MIRNAGFWASLTVFALAVAILIVEPRTTVALRNIAFDLYQRVEPRPYIDQGVRIVDIDDESLAKIGQWPWPRPILAELVRRLTKAGVKVIAFDVIFAEPDRTSPRTALKAWSERPDVANLIRELPDHDRQFADAISSAPVVLAFTVSGDAASAPNPVAKSGIAFAGTDPKAFLPRYTSAIASLPQFQAAARGNGAIRFTEQTDGIIRRIPALFHLGDGIYPSLWAEALRMAEGDNDYFIRSSGASGDKRAGFDAGIVSIKTGSVQFPTDKNGQVWLHFAQQERDRYIPAWRLLEDDERLGTLQDKVILVGTSAEALKDLRFTPFGAVAGVDIHAQAIEQALGNSFLSRPDWVPALEAAFLLLIWIILLVLATRLGALWSAVIALAVIVAAILASWHAFVSHRLLIDPLLPTLMSIALYIAYSLPRHMQSERQQRWIRQAFSTYISPNLVQHLIDNPDSLRLGGERRECSFVLTDLAGFTALVERSDPADMVNLLNDYLDGMVAVALDHDGTLDRIIGDAVAVMFSAPVVQPDHADRAIACALAMDAFARDFQAVQQAAGVVIGRTRIGVNSGTVIIGNVGGKSLFDYRALGDAINTTSRLESINRQLGTNICVSGETVGLASAFTGRPVGELLLVGKSEPVAAFEPLPAAALETERIKAYLSAYQLMKAEDAGALAAFEQLMTEASDDPLVQLHRTRLQAGETGATVTFETK